MRIINRKKIIKGICFVLIFAILFIFFQRLLRGKWVWTIDGTETAHSTSTWEEYKALSPNSIEVLFLGTSHVYHGIDPMYIYEKSGITSYAVAGPGLRMDLTYLSLKEALRTQNPSTVFLDMSAIHWDYQQEEGKCHKVTDQFKWSLEKLEYAFNNENEDLKPMDVMFPLLRYHTRWEELNENDFKYVMNDLEETFVRGHFITYDRTIATFHFEEDLEYNLSDRNKYYFDRIVKLCEKKDINLILYKIPSPSWYKVHSEGAKDLAEEYGLTYWEPYYALDEIGLNVNTDFRDENEHLNQYGAEKFGDYLIDYMKDNCDITDQRATNAEWNDDLVEYKKIIQSKLESSQLN